jgi:peptidyl-prolyl cis-trans isomerase A (cyclophilin A)
VRDIVIARKSMLVFTVIALIGVGCDRGHTKKPVIMLQTERGDIKIEIYSQKAPLTAGNFLRYVDEGRFSSVSFYRTVRLDNQPNDIVKIEVVQGGMGFVESDARLPPIAHETTAQTGIRHKDGIISMARAAPGTASSEFFICIGDQPELDYGGKRNPDGQGFAAFGRVVAGMDVVRMIHGEPAKGQMMVKPVGISVVQRIDKHDLGSDTAHAGGEE